MWPMTVSPLKARNYRGNLGLEAQYYSLATGIKKTEAELDFDAERVIQLHRGLTMLQMNSKEMRNEHDTLPDWLFSKDKKAFTKGADYMDRDDMEKALDMFYESFGWDKATGAPTKATLLKFGLADVAEALDKKGLLVV
jgi:aldehyde:ferredoxin oxidoreductase